MAAIRILAAALLLVSTSCAAASPLRTQGEAQWLAALQEQAVASGISEDVVHEALDGFVPDSRVIELDQRQPESRISYDSYRRNVVTPARIRKGAELMRRYADLLADLERDYGVAPSVVVALWGIESSFGANTGGFDTITSLATLAYEGRRADFFRAELLNALRIVEQEKMPPSALRGSWAGAMGQCQFMPTTYLKYAVDGDGDGRRDIWNNETDALASIAAYLSAEGWRGDLTWGREVKASARASEMSGLTVTQSLLDWPSVGVSNLDGSPLPQRDIPASLLQPDGAEGRSYLVYDNLRALMRWNRSTYFALAVGEFSDAIRHY